MEAYDKNPEHYYLFHMQDLFQNGANNISEMVIIICMFLFWFVLFLFLFCFCCCSKDPNFVLFGSSDFVYQQKWKCGELRPKGWSVGCTVAYSRAFGYKHIHNVTETWKGFNAKIRVKSWFSNRVFLVTVANADIGSLKFLL